MCGRATYKLTWEEIVALYRLPSSRRSMSAFTGKAAAPVLPAGIVQCGGSSDFQPPLTAALVDR
jgi:hypothetical protein